MQRNELEEEAFAIFPSFPLKICQERVAPEAMAAPPACVL